MSALSGTETDLCVAASCSAQWLSSIRSQMYMMASSWEPAMRRWGETSAQSDSPHLHFSGVLSAKDKGLAYLLFCMLVPVIRIFLYGTRNSNMVMAHGTTQPRESEAVNRVQLNNERQSSL